MVETDVKNKIKKNFLQACINYGSLDWQLIMNIIEPMCEKHEINMMDKDGVQELVKNINKDLFAYDQKLTFVKHALVGEEFLVFSCIVASDISKFQSHYTDQDRVYFGLVMDAIANSNTLGITSIDANNLSSSVQGKPFSKNHCQELLKNWINQGYYIENDSNIYWGPRLIVEFASHLKTQFPDVVQDCSLCSKLVLWDKSCTSCDAQFHEDCIEKFLSKNSNCPACRREWTTSPDTVASTSRKKKKKK